MGETQRRALRVDFDRELQLEFHGAKVTSDAGLKLNRREAMRYMGAAVGLMAMSPIRCAALQQRRAQTQAQSPAPSASPTPTASPAPTASGLCESDGLKIYYETFGAGRPIVLVHGWGADIKSNWIATGWLKALQPVRRVIALDCRGHGRSDKPHDQKLYSYGAMARDVLALMDHLGLSKADYFGYSMGAFMGAYLLGHNAERFTSMIMGGIGDETEESKSACLAIAEALRAKDPSQIKNPLGLAYRTYADSNPTNDLEALALSALQMWPEGYPLQLGGLGLGDVNIPVLIANGAADHPYVDSDEKVAAAIPGAELVRIPDASHLSGVSDPRLKEAVLGFLKNH